MEQQMTVGSKQQVYSGSAHHTPGGLKKADLVRNKHGRIVSRRKMEAGRRSLKFLTRKGYVAKKGQFKLFRKTRKSQ